MSIIIKNLDGKTEISFKKKYFDGETVIFETSIVHEPFFATMDMTYDMKELRHMIAELEEMHCFKRDKASFSSCGWDLEINFRMSETGHVHAEVSVYAGSRGKLSYNFELDQTIIKNIIDQIQNELPV